MDLSGQVGAAVRVVSAWQVASSLVAVAGNVLLARYLGTRLFGAWAVSAFVLAVVGVLIEFGIPACLIRRGSPPGDAFQRTAFTLTLLFALVWSLIVWLALAPAVAAWYRDPDVHTLLTLSVWGLVLSSCFRLSQCWLERDLEYRSVMMGEFLGQLGLYLPGTVLAALGCGALSLAAGEICRGLAAAYWFAKRPFKVGLQVDREAAREILGFGAAYVGMVLSWANLSALNPVVVGKLAGIEAAGIIRQADGLANHIVVLKRIADRVAYPALARLQRNGVAMRASVEAGRLYQFVLGVWPLFALTAVAPWLVPWVYGERWRGVASVLPVLCLTLAVNTLFSLQSAALVGAGRSGDVLRFSLAYSAILWACDPPLVLAFGYLGHPLAAACGIPAYALLHRAFASSFGRIGYAAMLRILVPSWLLAALAWSLPPLAGIAAFLAGHAALLAVNHSLRRVVAGLPGLLRGRGLAG